MSHVRTWDVLPPVELAADVELDGVRACPAPGQIDPSPSQNATVSIVIVFPANASLDFLVEKKLRPADVPFAYSWLQSPGIKRRKSLTKESEKTSEFCIPFLKWDPLLAADELNGIVPFFLLRRHGQRRKLCKTPSTAGEALISGRAAEQSEITVPDFAGCYFLKVSVPGPIFEAALLNTTITAHSEASCQYYTTTATLDLSRMEYSFMAGFPIVRMGKELAASSTQRDRLLASMAETQRELDSLELEMNADC